MNKERDDVVAANGNAEIIIVETERLQPETKAPKQGSRAELLRQVRLRDIKYPYILNKKELKAVLETGNPMVWKEIIDKAKARRKLVGESTK